MALRLSKDTLQGVSDFYNTTKMEDDNSEQRSNHVDCPAGEDTRNRLYMKKSEDGSKVLCHCFNCGASGAIKLKGSLSILKSPTADEVVNSLRKRQEFDRWEGIYHHSTPVSYDMVVEGRFKSNDWPFSMLILSDECEYMDSKEWYGLRCADTKLVSTNCIILPRGKHGFDVRWPDKSMKRITDPDYEKESKVLIYNSTNSDVGVIVEDPLSAMKVDMAGFAGVALLGSSLSKDDAFKLSMRFKYLIVWLDNDSNEVRANAMTAYNRVTLYTDNVDLESLLQDPKKYSYSVVQRNIAERLKLSINYNKKD